MKRGPAGPLVRQHREYSVVPPESIKHRGCRRHSTFVPRFFFQAGETMTFSIWDEAFPAESKYDGLGFQCCILSNYKRCEAIRVLGRQLIDCFGPPNRAFSELIRAINVLCGAGPSTGSFRRSYAQQAIYPFVALTTCLKLRSLSRLTRF